MKYNNGTKGCACSPRCCLNKKCPSKRSVIKYFCYPDLTRPCENIILSWRTQSSEPYRPVVWPNYRCPQGPTLL